MFNVVFFALSLQAATSIPAADIKVDDRVETYGIEGNSSAQLWDQIDRLGPIDPSQGKHVSGYTKWHVVWQYRFQSDDHSCRIENFDVSLTTVMTLPHWVNEERAGNGLRSRWNTFTTKLGEHEAGHRQNGLSAAQSVRKVLLDAVPQPDCKVLDQKVTAAADEALARYNQADREYDQLTNHGAKQGAVLSSDDE